MVDRTCAVPCLLLLAAAAGGLPAIAQVPPPATSRLVLAPTGEPGRPLVVTGRVLNASGEPIAGAGLHVFQTDARGHYTPERPMDEPNARLRGRLTADGDGRFAIETIRPGGYPQPVELRGAERYIPAHIHFEVTAPGHRERRFQLVFADDPRMEDEYWRSWAEKGEHPVAEVHRVAGIDRCRVEIVLESR